MEIELGTWPAKRMLIGCLAVLVVVGLALLGRGVTPVEGDSPAILTPARWAAASLSRQAHAETARLQRDAGELRTFLAGPASPDPVRAMLLAQRLYAGHRQGTSATAGARQALIDAAATAARYASGAASRDQAVAALNEALARIQVLAGPASSSEGALSQVFLALVLTGAHDRRGVRPDLGAAP